MADPYCPRVCSECGAKDAIIVNEQAAEVVCTECGVVHQMGLVESTQTAFIDDVVAPNHSVAEAVADRLSGDSRKLSVAFERTLQRICDRTGATEEVAKDAKELAVEYLEHSADSGRGAPKGDSLAVACFHLASLRQHAPVDLVDAQRDLRLTQPPADLVSDVFKVLKLEPVPRAQVLDDAVRVTLRRVVDIENKAQLAARRDTGVSSSLLQAAAALGVSTGAQQGTAVAERIITDEAAVATVAAAFARSFDDGVSSGVQISVIAAVSIFVALATPLSKRNVAPVCGSSVAQRLRFVTTKIERQRLQALLVEAGRCASGFTETVRRLSEPVAKNATETVAERWANKAAVAAAVQQPSAGQRRERE